MLECSHCGELLKEFRPKFFMISEKFDPMPANMKQIRCPKCGGVNYALNLEHCKECKYFKPLYNPLSREELLNVGCRGQCLNV